MAAAAASGLAAKRIGTGPAAASPSNMWACRYHVFTSTAGKLSLERYNMYEHGMCIVKLFSCKVQ